MQWGSLKRTAVSTLFVVSGLLTIAAARQRWWPACRLGDFDAPACLARQDNVYDYVLPAAPWVSAGNAAELEGMALLVLAVAVALLPMVLRGGHHRTLTLTLCALAFLGLLTGGALTWFSGQAGHAVTGPALGAGLWFAGLAWPLILLWMVLLHASADQPGIGWTLLFFALLMASTPIAEIFLAPLFFGYTSYDTTPWSEAVSGTFLVAAAIAMWPASRGQASTGGPTSAGSQPRSHSHSHR